MVFYETSIFTSRILELLSDESYRELQNALIANPEAGDLIPGSNGLRKIRWKGSGRGKRGGLRVIYYLVTKAETFMIYVYPKNDQENLTADQTRQLRQLVDEHFKP
jgi:mRNA-degrading endonuclease RelE of RelBE toxin-antitoxin system